MDITDAYSFFDRIPSSSWVWGDDGTVLLEQGVKQAGFANVGLANQGNGRSFAKNFSLSIGTD